MEDSTGQNLCIRPVGVDDTPRVAALATQLGYPALPDEMRTRLERMNADPQHAVFVADNGNQVVGWVHVYARKTLAREGDAEIGGLIVDESYRGHGIGGRLTHAATAWAKGMGCRTVIVRSNVVREQTEKFYLGLGFVLIKKQTVFRLPLDAE